MDAFGDCLHESYRDLRFSSINKISLTSLISREAISADAQIENSDRARIKSLGCREQLFYCLTLM